MSGVIPNRILNLSTIPVCSGPGKAYFFLVVVLAFFFSLPVFGVSSFEVSGTSITFRVSFGSFSSFGCLVFFRSVVAPLHVPYPISWADEERDVTAWLGNELQNEAFEELYKMKNKVNALKDPVLTHDFDCLQASDQSEIQNW